MLLNNSTEWWRSTLSSLQAFLRNITFVNSCSLKDSLSSRWTSKKGITICNLMWFDMNVKLLAKSKLQYWSIVIHLVLKATSYIISSQKHTYLRTCYKCHVTKCINGNTSLCSTGQKVEQQNVHVLLQEANSKYPWSNDLYRNWIQQENWSKECNWKLHW